MNMNYKSGMVILNYNSHDMTVKLANRLADYSAVDHICVVDNCSKDNFDKDFNNEKIHYIKNTKNSGYNAGNNVGLKYLIEQCKCDYVFISNPDVDFNNETVIKMCEAFEKYSDLAIVSTKRYGFAGEKIHQYFEFPSLRDSIKKCFFLTRRNFKVNNNNKQLEQLEHAENGIIYVDAIPGAFFGIRSSFLKEIGYLYEGIFLYGEEIILGRQVLEKGFKAGVINTGEYYHNHIQTRFSKSNKKMFWYDRKSLIKYFEKFNLLNSNELLRLKIAVVLGTLEYNIMSCIYNLLKKDSGSSHTLQALDFSEFPKFDSVACKNISVNSAEDYIEYIAKGNFARFNKIGYAVPGHNGPHGHIDTPVRNTSHYLIIYCYLYKKKKIKEYKELCEKFVDYLIDMQMQSSSGAIKCMESDKFDHLNGLIGQAWVIEALVYYYETFGDMRALETAGKIYNSQIYDKDMHLWRRVELDGTDIGVDNAYNHQVWFAACSYKLAKYLKDNTINSTIIDFLTKGAERDFCIYSNGILRHTVNIKSKVLKKERIKRFIKICCTPLKRMNPRKFDYKYIERAYHIFDMYGFSILEEEYKNLPLFKSTKYKKALAKTKDIVFYNRDNNAVSKDSNFNVYSYSYNSPAFEYPYVAKVHNCYNLKMEKLAFKTQKMLMYDLKSGLFLKNNPDIETWNARTYEIIRALEYMNA